MMDLTFSIAPSRGGIRNGTTLFTMPPAQKKLGPIQFAGGKRFSARSL